MPRPAKVALFRLRRIRHDIVLAQQLTSSRLSAKSSGKKPSVVAAIANSLIAPPMARAQAEGQGHKQPLSLDDPEE